MNYRKMGKSPGTDHGTPPSTEGTNELIPQKFDGREMKGSAPVTRPGTDRDSAARVYKYRG